MTTSAQRQQLFVNAVTAGVHAHQARACDQTGRGDAAAFGFPLPAEERDALAGIFSRMVRASSKAVQDWVQRGPDSRIDIPDTPPYTTVDECVARLTAVPIPYAKRLPVSVVHRHLERAAPNATPLQISAVASLYQVVLGVMLDAVELQDLFRVYVALNLPVSLDELGLPDDDASLSALGKTLAAGTCECPFGVKPADWHLASRKLKNWGDKYRGKVTVETYARELLTSPEVRACATGLRMMPPQRIVVCGHSFTMSAHWASPASFTDIAGQIVRHFNPEIDWLHIGRGGLTPTVARRSLFEQVLQLRPDQLILVTISRTDENRSDLKYIIECLQERGTKVLIFDCLMVQRNMYEAERPAAALARAAGAEVIEVFPLLDGHPKRDTFPALDAIHTAPPYHKFMAVELVRYLAGKRPAALPASVA